ncbi:MAG TPA: DUF1569 domain-containing protein [Pseudomonadota bacterium]|jgi:hypothetical protein|nr:DUF1569 domain-containing protein [Pseudomonadota bacterium]HNI60292.1 DUF1569 domain-containing protein [Pseudomonadota bacterium]HNN50298.1 DUF1569 domain-containing protein [Pseudomonadota bacterium]
MMNLHSFSEVLVQLDRIAPATGLGAALAHCAQSIEYSLTGFPTQRGLLVRTLIGPLLLRKYLRQGFLSHDVKAPIPGAPPLSPDLAFTDGAERLRRAISEFRSHRGILAPHFAFGKVSREDYEKLHAMHLADHLRSFL